MQLRDDQVARLSFLMRPDQKKCLDLSDPGTGKTPPVIVNQLRRLQEGRQSLWVQPKSLIAKNVEEIMAWTGLPRSQIGVLDGGPAKIQEELLADKAIYLCGPTRLDISRQAILAKGFKAVDTDELHMCFGGSTSRRTTAYFDVMRQAEEGVGMTGSLINGRLDTAYPAIHVINSGYYPFGYEQFIGAHAFVDQYNRPLSWHGHDRLRAILQRHAIRWTFEQIFGAQEVIFETEWVSMEPEQRRMFDELREKAFLELDDFFVDGTQPGVNMIRARQVMEIPNFFPDLRDPKAPRIDILKGKRPAKLDSLHIHFDHHRRCGTPVVVFAYFQEQVEQIAKLARDTGLSVGTIHGGVSSKRRGEVDQAFCRGELQAVIASEETAAVGFNWQDWGPNQIELDHVIFASLDFKDTNFSQGYKRGIRRKRSKPLRVTTMGYFDSIDRRLMQILERKSRDANKVDPSYQVIKFNSHRSDDE